MFRHIIDEFPREETYDTYIESFGGSYTVGLNMPYIPHVEIYNDLEKTYILCIKFYKIKICFMVFRINTYIRRGTSKSISDYLSAVEHLQVFHERIKNLIVSNTDDIKLMKRYSKDNVFMYLDPPYVQDTRTSNTRYCFDMDDNQQDVFLEESVNNKAKLLISGYDNDKYNLLLDNGFTKKHFESNNRIETLWKNY